MVSSRVERLTPGSLTKFLSMAGTVDGLISLGIGEPDFVTPYVIREKMIDSLLDGQTQYSDSRGLPPLRAAIADYLLERHRLTYDPDTEVLVTIGASEAIDLVLRAVLNEGDEVLLPDPGYISYEPCVALSGGVAVPVATDDGFEVTREALESAVTPRAKALVLSYPHNPTGALLDDRHLAEVAAFAREHDLLVISDEIYNELVYDGFRQTSIAGLDGMRERTATLNGFSKAFAMTGHRLGYIAAPKWLVDACAKVHANTVMCAARASQYGALEALRQGKETGWREVLAMRDSYDRRRRLMYKALSELGLPCLEPKGAFYLFPDITSTGLDADTFCERLLREKAVVCIPGTAFGARGAGHIRCCYATAADKIVEAFDRIGDFLHTVRKEGC